MATTFTVPADGDYQSLSNGGVFRYHEGDVIPLDLALDLQMPGASAPEATNPFSGEQAAWIAANPGPTGPTGTTGATGATGPTGVTGATGPTGPGA